MGTSNFLTEQYKTDDVIRTLPDKPQPVVKIPKKSELCAWLDNEKVSSWIYEGKNKNEIKPAITLLKKLIKNLSYVRDCRVEFKDNSFSLGINAKYFELWKSSYGRVTDYPLNIWEQPLSEDSIIETKWLNRMKVMQVIEKTVDIPENTIVIVETQD